MPPTPDDPVNLDPRPVPRRSVPVLKPAFKPKDENDPEQIAREFIEKNQKVAETELATLKKEAEALRNRLQKVESAIKRWESVAHALKQSGGVASKADGSWKPNDPSPRRANFDEMPTALEPVSPADVREKSGDDRPPVAPFVPSDDLLPVAPSAPTAAAPKPEAKLPAPKPLQP